MKKILLAAVATLAMVSCSQNEIDGIDNGKQDGRKEIKFGYSPVTRSTEITTSNFNHFIVYAYAGADYSSTAGNLIIDKGEFDKKPDWTSTKKYYWPETGNLSFLGYNLDDARYKTDGAYPTLEYAIKSTIAAQEDLLVSKHLNQAYSNSDISLPFKHALSQVLFTVEGDDANLTYTVENIKINQVDSVGTYNYNSAEWTATNKPADYTITPSANVEVAGTTPQPFADANGVAILMPQDVTDKTINITYSAKYTSGGAAVKVESPATVTLKGSWTSGKRTTYKLVLSAAQIKLAGAEETAWGEDGVTDNQN